MKATWQQSGWSRTGALGVIVAAVCGALAFKALSSFMPDHAMVAVPWTLISVLLLPLTFAVQLLFKTGELKQQKGISREEKRRLDVIVDGKIRQIHIAIGFYLLSAVLIVLAFILSSTNPALFRTALIVTGGLLGISLFSVALILGELRALTDFKAKIHDRELTKERQQATFKRLKVK